MKDEPASASTGPDFYVVGIGASAGGLRALQTLFSRMPPAPGIAFVVVVHLSPEHESHLVELLQPYTPMSVQQVSETVALEPNHVYVIPPGANLSAIDTHLRLSELEERRRERAPIDHFLRTLAAAHDGAAVGVILTGTGSDGALGLRKIKERAGLTIAQDPAEAEYDGMPRSAIETGMVDLVLPLHAIPNEIVRFCSMRPRLPIPDGNDAIDESENAVLEQVFGELRLRTGQEFSIYTRATVLRRVRYRMQLRNVATLREYLAALRSRPDEARALRNDLLLTVAEFFREPETFSRLENEILPELFDGKTGPNDRLRVWSIGCSTGEEAYSLAILLLEEAAEREARPQLQLFASDLSADVLKRARAGAYPHEIAATVSAERLERFFVKEPGHYLIGNEIRDIVVFAAHNLFTDPPYVHLDMIVCRDLLYELQPEVRRGVLSLFHYALEPNGVLVVGRQDDVDERLFTCKDQEARLFCRKNGPRQPLQLPASLRPFVREGLRGAWRDEQAPASDVAVIHRQAAERYAPPSLLVNAANEVVYYSAYAGRYVRIPGGELTHDVLKLVSEPLRSPLAEGLERVRLDAQPWKSDVLTVRAERQRRRVVLRVEPIQAVADSGLLLVLVDELHNGESLDAESSAETATAGTVASLEDELAHAHRRLHAALEASSEDRAEFSAANENLQTTNEELRFIMEEVQSSKEELQALNEELTTLDQENRHRLDELSQLSGDLRHLLESTGIATMFLDIGLNIVRFTPLIGELFSIKLSDVGRPLSDLTNTLLYNDFRSDAAEALQKLALVEREVASKNGRWFLARIVPYRTGARVDGVVLTLVDITDRKRAEEKLRQADRRKDEFLALLAHELRNPLAPISSGVEVLKAAGNDPRIVEQVSATMGRQTRQLVRLVDDLLEISRVSGGRLRLRKSRVELADVIRDAIAAMRPAIEKAGHELAVSVPEEPIVLHADAARLTQVLTNLLNNATRYTPQEGKIALTAKRDGDAAVVVVRDNGYGITSEVLGHVFEMFYRGEDPRLIRNAGLGIGLTLARSLVEMHGGTISVSSAGVDQGSEFEVRLPISKEDAPASRPVPKRLDLGGHRVLIVDDNADAARTLSMQLQTLGENDVQTALSGVEALEAAAELRPDIVLLDLKMPEMDGYEVARRIRGEAWGKDVLLVALTGWDQEEHKRRTQETGFDRHLTKPANRAALEAVLGASRPTNVQLAQAPSTPAQ